MVTSEKAESPEVIEIVTSEMTSETEKQPEHEHEHEHEMPEDTYNPALLAQLC